MSSKYPQDTTAAERTRVGYVDRVFGGSDTLGQLAALFPTLDFVSVGAEWPAQKLSGLGALIIGADIDDAETVLKRLGADTGGPPVILVLPDPDVATARRLIMAGATDVLASPVREGALALSLERLLAGRKSANAPAGRVIGLIKAGGGVGATAIGTQLAQILASRRSGVCFADLDIQFGQAALKLDIDDAMTLTDILGGDGAVDEAPLAAVLATHMSGVRLLAAPRDMTPLEAVSQQNIEGLVKSLRREFSLTLLDLPTVWTAWTNQALQLCDQIILVTNLTVSHIQLTRRQLRTMASQGLDVIPLILVCNKVGDDQQNLVSVSAAEKAMGRKFNFIVPEDRKLMNSAIAQGCALSAVRVGSKLEKAIERLADELDPESIVKDAKPKRRWL